MTPSQEKELLRTLKHIARHLSGLNDQAFFISQTLKRNRDEPKRKPVSFDPPEPAFPSDESAS